ncbi:MAG: queuosine precursor transporter [candidate division Zixibacteria bacterium]|nr:queuosine precursor transporter [candidate division Zixibacteria bacterium]MBU1470982.1 queuosine precursor transporter [candidate division Zixibacteria bacterium]MBU2626973.1 queuosine precursor transporter [candidate division Zixibacteria bacterium]
MHNEILWILFVIFDLSVVLLAFRLWGKNGLYAMIACSGVICNIQVVITVQLFGLVATLGNIVYASIFLATDILSEHFGPRAARKGVWIGFFTLIWATVAMQFAVHFVPDESDFMLGHVRELFSLMPRIVVASLVAYLISQHHDIWAFDFWKKRTAGKHLWLRNNASTLISQLMDSLVFTLIAFVGEFDTGVLIQILITTYLMKVIVAVADTPFVYLSRSFARRESG